MVRTSWLKLRRTGEARRRHDVRFGQRRMDRGCQQGPQACGCHPRRIGMGELLPGDDPAVPFGGYKMSGYRRESGIQQMDEYLNVKAVWIKTG
jgi:hypothetical protein